MEQLKFKKLIEYMELGEIISEPEQITGGLMHTMYSVATTAGRYAVKVLNSSIMEREMALTNFINSELIANELARVVPAVIALKKDDSSVIEIEGTYFLIFTWQEGESIFPDKIDLKHCKMIGDILGKIHTAKLPKLPIIAEEVVGESFDWRELLEIARKQSASWIEVVEENLEYLQEWNEEANQATIKLQIQQVISHRDLDPKNVMWKDDEPYLIDWEAAGYVNPYQELLELITYWAGDGKGEIDKDKFIALVGAYKEHCVIDNVDWDIVLDSGFSGMLGWLAYNMSRSLGIESSSDEERKLGTKQVFETLHGLQNYNRQKNILKVWLIEISNET